MDSCITSVPSKATRRMSHASLAISKVEIILNYVGSTTLMIAFWEREFWVGRASSSNVHSTSLLGTFFPSALVLVGDFHPCKTISMPFHQLIL